MRRTCVEVAARRVEVEERRLHRVDRVREQPARVDALARLGVAEALIQPREPLGRRCRSARRAAEQPLLGHRATRSRAPISAWPRGVGWQLSQTRLEADEAVVRVVREELRPRRPADARLRRGRAHRLVLRAEGAPRHQIAVERALEELARQRRSRRARAARAPRGRRASRRRRSAARPGAIWSRACAFCALREQRARALRRPRRARRRPGRSTRRKAGRPFGQVGRARCTGSAGCRARAPWRRSRRGSRGSARARRVRSRCPAIPAGWRPAAAARSPASRPSACASARDQLRALAQAIERAAPAAAPLGDQELVVPHQHDREVGAGVEALLEGRAHARRGLARARQVAQIDGAIRRHALQLVVRGRW